MVQKYKNIPNSFVNFNISPFIDKKDSIDPYTFSLNNVNRFPFDIGFLADQLAIYSKAASKLPTFCKCYCLYTPQSYEQSSSEIVALFKANIYDGEVLLDLSGGLGVDDWAFSAAFKKVISIDNDAELNKLVRANFERLGLINISRLDADAYQFVVNTAEKFDVIYLDADRRPEAKRTFALVDTEPNILKLKEKLFELTATILIKVSPMLDIHALIKELEQVTEIWVISVKNEVKEILLKLSNTREIPIIHAFNLELNTDPQSFSEKYNSINVDITYANDGLWFYEPSLSLIKANLATRYFKNNNIAQVAQNSIYGVADMEISTFFGRKFKLYDSFEFSKSKLKTYLNNNCITKANIAKRNFPMEVDEIRKAMDLKDGGDHYLFFTTDANNTKRVFHCIKP